MGISTHILDTACGTAGGRCSRFRWGGWTAGSGCAFTRTERMRMGAAGNCFRQACSWWLDFTAFALRRRRYYEAQRTRRAVSVCGDRVRGTGRRAALSHSAAADGQRVYDLSRKLKRERMIELAENRYGKSRVRLMKVLRGPDGNELREWTVQVLLKGDFDSAHYDGDNSKILADGHDEEHGLLRRAPLKGGVDGGLCEGAGRVPAES